MRFLGEVTRGIGLEVRIGNVNKEKKAHSPRENIRREITVAGVVGISQNI